MGRGRRGRWTGKRGGESGRPRQGGGDGNGEETAMGRGATGRETGGGKSNREKKRQEEGGFHRWI